MKPDAVSTNILAACDKMGQKPLMGVSLESADPRFLDVTESTLDEHISIQPTAIAFFGNLRKLADRRLEQAKRKYERWQKVKFHEMKSLGVDGKRITIAEVEASVLVKYASDIENFEKELDQLQEEYDTLDSWYEAWRQKSHTLREYAAIQVEEYNSSPHVMRESANQNGEKLTLKDIIRERRSESNRNTKP